MLFKLHLPSRYTGLSFRIIIATATAITITILLDICLRMLERQDLKQLTPFYLCKSGISFGLISVILASLLLYPSWVPYFPLVKYREGEAVELYTFFQQQPKDIVIASLSGEVNQIPTFAQRSILVGREYMIPYQVGYYHQMNQKLIDLLQAHYSPNLEDVKNLVQTYGVDFFLMERYAFTPEYFQNNDWMMEFEAGQQAVAQLQAGTIPRLVTTIDQCAAFENQTWIILDANCLLNL
jgi:hypothetical protein